MVNIDQVADPAHKSKLYDLTQLSTVSMSSSSSIGSISNE